MPTVYEVKKDAYILTVTHGQRYWPEFFIEARSSKGDELAMMGRYIEEVPYRWGGDMRRLREARGTDPSHKTVELSNVAGSSVKIEVLDDSGALIGQHELSFELQDVKCMELDGL